MIGLQGLDDGTLAATLAREAGRILLDLRSSRDDSGLSGAALGRKGDAEAQTYLAAALAGARPDDAVFSEEAPADAARLAASRVWIIDPLDGTREYGQGRDDWAVHVALTIDGVPVASAVALPALNVYFDSGDPPRLPPAPVLPMKILVSRNRMPVIAPRVAERLGAELVPMGSAGAKAMAVLQGQAHAYLHAGGMQQWDSCAPVGVALAAGLHASRIGGAACIYNGADSSMPDLLICRAELAGDILAAIAAATATVA